MILPSLHASLFFRMETPLHEVSNFAMAWAIEGHLQVCQFLVACKADVEARSRYPAPAVTSVLNFSSARPFYSFSAAWAALPSKKLLKITGPMLLRIFAASQCQNKQLYSHPLFIRTQAESCFFLVTREDGRKGESEKGGVRAGLLVD